MRYISTRGQAPALNFEEVLLAGLASDGGLYVPENLPRFSLEEIASWAGLPYHELAFRVMKPSSPAPSPMPNSRPSWKRPTPVSPMARLRRCASWTPTNGYWSCSTVRPWPSRTSPCNCWGGSANNYQELSTWIGQNKGKINLGHAGLGAASHLCGLLYQNALKVEMTTVAYKGTAPAITDLIGGQIDLLCDQTTNTTSQIEAKKVKAYAVTTAKRLTTPSLKDLPTLAESGVKDFQVTIWHGLYAPKGTPAEVVAKLNEALKAALKDPDFIKKQEGLGAVVAATSASSPPSTRSSYRPRSTSGARSSRPRAPTRIDDGQSSICRTLQASASIVNGLAIMSMPGPRNSLRTFAWLA